MGLLSGVAAAAVVPSAHAQPPSTVPPAVSGQPHPAEIQEIAPPPGITISTDTGTPLTLPPPDVFPAGTIAATPPRTSPKPMEPDWSKVDVPPIPNIPLPPAPPLPLRQPAAPPRVQTPPAPQYNVIPPPVPLSLHSPGNLPVVPPVVGRSPQARPTSTSNEHHASVLYQQNNGQPLPPLPGPPKDTSVEDELLEFEPPGPGRLFGAARSDAALFEQMRQEARDRKASIELPAEIVLSQDVYYGRAWPLMHEVAEPNYVCYRRTYFEQKNFERYGWELGIIQPFVSAGKFYWDVIWLPYNMGTEPFRHYECNAGYCLPGDPTPLLLYPPRLSVTGALSQAAAVGGLNVLFP